MSFPLNSTSPVGLLNEATLNLGPRGNPPLSSLAPNDYRSTVYPRQMWYILACFIAVVGISQLISRLSMRGGLKSVKDLEGIDKRSMIIRAQRWRRIPFALVNAYRIVAFRSSFRLGIFNLSVAEIALTCLYIIALFIWVFINTTDPKTDERFAIKYYANRAATLSLSQLPLITLLGTKNNILSCLTGVSFEKFNYLHRMAARVVFVLLWVHAGARITSGIDSQDLSSSWLRAGPIGLSAVTVLVFVSIRPIRSRFYEAFFYTHLSMILTAFVAIYHHTKHFAAFSEWLWPCFILWGLDRSGEIMHARTELISKNLVRLTMKRPPHFHWLAGQTAYLIIPSVSTLPFEAHPFTISSYNSSNSDNSLFVGSNDTLDHEEKTKNDELYWNEVVFLVNIRGGFTRKLANIAEKKSVIKALLDGPYGLPPRLDSFDASVFVAGESGVSYTFPMLLDTVDSVLQNKSSCRRVVFIWAIRDAEHLNWVSDGLNSAISRCPSKLQLEVKVFVTGLLSSSGPTLEAQSVVDCPVTENGDSTQLLLNQPAMSLNHGRPDLASLLAEEVKLTEGGKVSVSVCGSSSLAEGTRSALGFSVAGPKSIMNGGASVSLYVESFGYA